MKKTSNLLRNVVCLSLLTLVSATFVLNSNADDDLALIAGKYQAGEALTIGERMYRNGQLPSGEIMTALVQGDIPVTGSMFSCMTCHLKSGLGSLEGRVITLPINGSWLFRPLPRGQEISENTRRGLSSPIQQGYIRPIPYTAETLARAIREGKDPVDRVLDYAMPRFKLDDEAMAVLIFYLQHLSSEFSPGVNDTEIHFATVVTDDVSPADRAAIVNTLEAIVRDRNSQSRSQEIRAKKVKLYHEEMNKSFRKFVLDVWTLTGAPDTWGQQLESYYRKKPVFALLSGISTKDWAHIHSFCETNKLPCLFPVTPYPVIDSNHSYTLYFSKGYYQEGETAARYVRDFLTRTNTEETTSSPVVMVYRKTEQQARYAQGFEETWKLISTDRATIVTLEISQKISATFWTDLMATYKPRVLVSWLSPEDTRQMDLLKVAGDQSRQLIFSGTMFDMDVSSFPASQKAQILLTYPSELPENFKKKQFVIERWLAVKNVQVTNFEIQAKMYFLWWVLSHSLKMMRDDFYRDYLLDQVDMLIDQDYAIAIFPRLSFGPGQRYASKGCYMVKVEDTTRSTIAPQSPWVIP